MKRTAFQGMAFAAAALAFGAGISFGARQIWAGSAGENSPGVRAAEIYDAETAVRPKDAAGLKEEQEDQKKEDENKKEQEKESKENQESLGNQNRTVLDITDLQEETEDLISELGLSELDAYMRQENLGQLSFSELIRDLMQNGLSVSFSSIGKKLGQILWNDYEENRTVLIQILALAIAFSLLLQMTSSIQKNYISNLGFLGVYLILMMMILRLFLLMTGIVEQYFEKIVTFMQMLQPAFCMSMVFSTGSMSAGVYCQLLLLIIYCVDVIFAKVLLPVVQVQLVLQLVNHMMEEERFSRIAGLLADCVHWCVKISATAVIGLNIVQGLLAPGIDGLKRSTAAGAVRIVPGIGQIMNSMTEILAGSAMLIKNSVGVAALVVLLVISFLPLVKIAVFMLLYRGLAALMEPVSDKRFCAAAAALGQSAGLYLKLMFYAVLLFFLTTAIICAATSLTTYI